MTDDDRATIPIFTIDATMPGAAKALRSMAAAVRPTNPVRADTLDKEAARFEAHASRSRPGAGFIPRR